MLPNALCLEIFDGLDIFISSCLGLKMTHVFWTSEKCICWFQALLIKASGI